MRGLGRSLDLPEPVSHMQCEKLLPDHWVSTGSSVPCNTGDTGVALPVVREWGWGLKDFTAKGSPSSLTTSLPACLPPRRPPGIHVGENPFVTV